MRIEPASATFATELAAYEVRLDLRNAFGELGAKVNDAGDDVITAKSGHKLLVRLLPWRFISDRWLPLQYSVRLWSDEAGTTVEILVTQSYGHGLSFTKMNRYAEVLQDRLSDLEMAIS